MPLMHNILNCSSVNGPGSRSVLWFQGCTVGCPGCTNFQTWTKIGGKEMLTQDLISILRNNIEEYSITGLTISGGEPTEQFESLYELVKSTKKELPELDILVFTGRYIENIKDYSILNYIDILVDGPFVASKLNYNITWRGSENQRIFLLNDNIRQKMKDFYKLLDANGNVIEEATGLELFIGPTGDIESTGFGPITDKSLKRLA